MGRYEFAVKALLVQRLAAKDSDTRLWIPACTTTSYDVLVESLIGPTVRRPSDMLCIGSDGRGPHVTVIEAKADRVRLDDVGQVTRYLDIFRARNRLISRTEYSVSGCLLGLRLDQDLRAYATIRTAVLGVEPLTLVEYLPNDDGTDATFRCVCEPVQPRQLPVQFEECTDLSDPLHSFERDPGRTYRRLKRLNQEDAPEVIAQSRTDVTLLLERSGGGGHVGSSVIRVVDGPCDTGQMRDLMTEVYRNATQAEFDLLSVEPVIIARAFDPAVSWFIKQYNRIEAFASRSPIFAVRY